MKDIVVSVSALDHTGAFYESIGEENQFSYRHSRFSDTDDRVVSAEFKLTKGNPDDIKAKMDELSAKRRSSQPLNMPSAGSTFKLSLIHI